MSTEGSIKAAAEKLHVSQPAISVQLKLFEEELGCKLFVRNNGPLKLTEIGELLTLRAENLFLQVDQLISDLPAMGSKRQENFALGVLQSLPLLWVSEFAQPLWKRESVVTTIFRERREKLLIELDSGLVNFILTDEMETRFERYFSVLLKEASLYFVARKGVFNSEKSFPECLNDLRYFPIVNQSQVNREIEHFFLRNHLTPKIFGHVDSLNLMIYLLKENDCFGLVPMCAVQNEIDRGELEVIGELPDIHLSMWGVCSRSSSKTEGIMSIIDSFFEGIERA